MSVPSTPTGEQAAAEGECLRRLPGRVSFHAELPTTSGAVSMAPGAAQPGAAPQRTTDARPPNNRRHKANAELSMKQGMRGAVLGDAGIPTNTDLEAEAAAHAVNYHRVRRVVQEDIRRSLLQNPVIRNQLSGPRVMAKDTMTYLAKPADTRGAPVKGFRDDSTVDWILCKTGEVSRQREVKQARDAELRAFKEDQARELEVYRQRMKAAAAEIKETRHKQSEARAVRAECATRVVNTKGRLEIRQYAADQKRKIEKAKKKRGAGGFVARV
eukprot:jgi/Tetstr1/444107/TSEL_032006.t1